MLLRNLHHIPDHLPQNGLWGSKRPIASFKTPLQALFNQLEHNLHPNNTKIPITLFKFPPQSLLNRLGHNPPSIPTKKKSFHPNRHNRRHPSYAPPVKKHISVAKRLTSPTINHSERCTWMSKMVMKV